LSTSPTDAFIELARSYGLAVAIGILVMVGTAMLVVHFMKSFLERKAALISDKQLEQFKSQLQLEAESVRLHHQRQLHDFTLYTAQRHRVYPQMFKRLLMAEGGFNALWGIMFGPDWEKQSKTDIENWVIENDFPKGASKEAIALLDTNPREAHKKLNEIMDTRKRFTARKALRDARNYQVLNELYLSAEVAAAVEKSYQALVRYSVQAEDEENADYNVLTNRRDEAQIALNETKKVMQSELARGDYSVVKV